MHSNLSIWVLSKIESNPGIFGGRFSNPLIMLEYLKEFYPGVEVKDLTHEHMSTLSTISRIKNKLLEKYPSLDHRKRIQLRWDIS